MIVDDRSLRQVGHGVVGGLDPATGAASALGSQGLDLGLLFGRQQRRVTDARRRLEDRQRVATCALVRGVLGGVRKQVGGNVAVPGADARGKRDWRMVAAGLPGGVMAAEEGGAAVVEIHISVSSSLTSSKPA